MKLIVGLGNPDSKYDQTRHNIGFQIIDSFANELEFPVFKEDAKFKGFITDKEMNNEKVFLLKPLTYMNLSGQSVSAIINYYRISLNNVLVIHDDFDLKLGEIRLRQSATGKSTHNGLRSIVEYLGSPAFYRLRFGIGNTSILAKDVFVLQKFDEEEFSIVSEKIKESVIKVKKFLNL